MDHGGMAKILVVALILTLIGGSQSANILGIFTSTSPSHLIVHMSVAKVLAENGHNLTIITVLKPPVKHKDFNIIQVPLEKDQENQLNTAMASMAGKNFNMIRMLIDMLGQMRIVFDVGATALKDPRVVDLYENKDNKFDLAIVGHLLTEYQLGLAHKLKVPVILSATMPPSDSVGGIIGNPKDNTITGKGLKERFRTLALSNAFRIFNWFQDSRNIEHYKNLYGNDPAMPKYEDLRKNISLIFCNSHGLSEGPIRANLPGIVEIGGIQVKDKPAELPQNLKEFIGNATHGAILLSLGSNLKGDFIKPNTVKDMFKVLSQLKERVVWKWENLENTPGKSDNILYSKWLPQDDVLAHPKIKLFITHAGKGGISEAQYHGKPMLALPVLADQPQNAIAMAKAGFGLSLPLLELEEEKFRENLLEVLNNPKYGQSIKQFSQLYRDRPLTARQTVLYWVNYVLRHRGAAHLQSPVVHMGFLQANNLDIYFILLTLFVISIWLFKISITFIIRKVLKKKTVSEKVKNQ
ncbi:uncharacterized protein Dwil_GK14614 [Drosophila willistoni]|uniref:UDP-glycosyltransferases domain-containing protein n=1 Tax=Drosophila willistoni TaxID=7260 RepID=B4MWP0_DROWI|nr:UDP-glycosyltransferase UGT5 [Drosophila willistoni]EDW76529.2 uncharacterized protein Dwil_GK14614 [Drosophila willistoni]